MYIYQLDYKIDPEDYGELILYSEIKYSSEEFYEIICKEYKQIRNKVINEYDEFPACPDHRSLTILDKVLEEKYKLKPIYNKCETRIFIDCEEEQIKQTDNIDINDLNSGTRIIRETRL